MLSPETHDDPECTHQCTVPLSRAALYSPGRMLPDRNQIVGGPIVEMTRVSKTVRDSAVVMAQLMLPGDANPYGYVHGGTIMKLVDSAAGVVAARHTRRRVATVAVDSMSFITPVKVGDLVVLKASINDVGRTSMEVGVRVDVEDLMTGDIRHTSSAYLVMVALDDIGRPVPVPGVVAETPDEIRRQQAARVRRSRRLTLTNTYGNRVPGAVAD